MSEECTRAVTFTEKESTLARAAEAANNLQPMPQPTIRPSPLPLLSFVMTLLPTNRSINNDGSNHYGSIQVVTMDESSSLLQHRHPATATTSLQHQHDDDDSPTETSSPQVPPVPTPHFFSDHVKNHWNKYVDIVERRPLITKSVTATIILGGADLCAQGLEHIRGVSSNIGIDWPRAARFAAFGLFGAPWSHYYFHWLDTCIPPSNQPCSSTTFLKVSIDQFIQAPILLAIMISMLSFMKGEGIDGVKTDLRESYVDALIANCTCTTNPWIN